MMLVDTELRPSPIQGIGVFLLEDVEEGQLIWQFDSRVDRVYSKAELESLPAGAQEFIQTYSTWHKDADLYVLCGDNGRHFNHSATPNTVSDGIAFGNDRAARALKAGEELTSDYRTICDAMRLDPPSYVSAEPMTPRALKAA